MLPFKVTLKNYRCFDDSQPLTLEIGSGFTALVGPNNSGKSSFLKFFHELRPVIAHLGNPNMLHGLASGNQFGVGYQGTEDPIEIFHNRNLRPLTLEFEFPRLQPAQITRVRLTCERSLPGNWRGELFYEQPPVRLSGEAVVVGMQGFNLTPLMEAVEFMTDSMYVGAFRNPITEGGGSYYDFAIGTSFIQLWDSWKTGGLRNQNEVAQAVTDDIAHIFGYDRLEINAAGGQRILQAIVDGKPFRLRELGAGLAQFLVVFGNVAIRRPKWLLIDEPELNLHPSLQTDFLTSLASYTKHGVMFATHSVGLARTVGDRIYAFQKPSHNAVARVFEQTPNFAEFVGEMSFSSFKELGHESVLLVEGVTDVKAVQQFLRVLGKDHEVVVIPLGGTQLIRGGVQTELAELKRLSNAVAVLIDSERQQPGAPLAPERQAFVGDCEALGFAVHATDLRALENYLSEQAVQKVKGANYHGLGPYDELRNLNPGWGKPENWRIARAMTKAEIIATDVGQFLQKLE